MTTLLVVSEDGSGNVREWARREFPFDEDGVSAAYSEAGAEWALKTVQQVADRLAHIEGGMTGVADLDRDCAEATVELQDGSTISVYSCEEGF